MKQDDDQLRFQIDELIRDEIQEGINEYLEMEDMSTIKRYINILVYLTAKITH